MSSSSKPQLKLITTPPSPTTYSHLLYVDTPKRDSLMAANMPGSYNSSASSIHSESSSTSNKSAASSRTTTSVHSRLAASPKYADNHYPFITTLNLSQHLPHNVPHSHPSVWSAHHMAQVHNTIIRALNSSFNHCLSISPSTTAAKDFLFFNSAIATTLRQHHKTEDDFLFPQLERLMGKEGALHENTEQYKTFMDGLTVYTKYVTTTTADEYNGLTLRHIIESFAPKLIEYLHNEIPALLSTHVISDKKALMDIWKKAEAMVQKDNDLYITGPFFLGCQDKAFRIDGLEGDFPGVPWVLEQVVKRWYSRRYTGAWRYLPSDLSGRRRLLTRA